MMTSVRADRGPRAETAVAAPRGRRDYSGAPALRGLYNDGVSEGDPGGRRLASGAGTAPPADAVAARLAGLPAAGVLEPEVREELATRLARLLGAGCLADRLSALVRVVRWMRRGRAMPVPAADGSAPGESEPRRQHVLLDLLEADAALRTAFQGAVGAILAETDATSLFAAAGVPTERGFFSELGDRVMRRLLPQPRDDRDLAALLRRMFRDAREVEGFLRLEPEAFARLVRVLLPLRDTAAWQPLRRAFADGFRLLAAWVQAQGLAEGVRSRGFRRPVSESPFYRLPRASEELVTAWGAGEPTAAAISHWRDCQAGCRAEMVEVHRRLATEGVNTDLIYGLEVIERSLERMEAMLAVIAAASDDAAAEASRRLLTRLVVSAHQDRSVRHLLRWSTHLLQRRIVERSGQTGEHYIAHTRAAYRHIWLAAAGGGVLTAGTAAVKMAISALPASDFAHGVLYGLNYAVSFLLLQRFGLILATKQPAMTAATLAAIMRERRGSERAADVIELAARICRSQLAAAISNVVVVAAAAALLVAGWELAFSRALLAEETAAEVYTALSPINSGTVFFAALTGVILWAASVAGGWFDNFCAYHRVPEAIAYHPWRKRVGPERTARWGRALARNASGWGTNVSLGFMLGMTPAVGHFLGVPLDVRHVTLNSGILSLAAFSLGQKWFGDGLFVRGVVGVAVMFVLNLGVSFLLALATAARAYELPRREVRALLGALYRRFVTAPRDFVLPPRRDPPEVLET
jgi:site-specific recombinase